MYILNILYAGNKLKMDYKQTNICFTVYANVLINAQKLKLLSIGYELLVRYIVEIIWWRGVLHGF